ncbi:kinase-like domain-containing protein [Pisolithus albus]|nr:kinase-like domain-containing protein [Pisolithus albus]
MEAREILCEFSEGASKYTINLNGRIQREREPYTRGGNAFVYHGTLSPRGTTVAIKTALGVPQADKKTIKKMLREAHVWSKLDHPNVLPLLGITTDFDLTVSLVSTWMEKGSARYYVQKRHNDPRAIDLVTCTAIRRAPIIHGDLKGDNVLIAEDGRALLTDFGLSIHFNSSFAMTVNPPRGGSLHWMAPELVDAQNGMLATIESDIWSFGMTTLVCRVALPLSRGLLESCRNFSLGKCRQHPARATGTAV